MSNIYNETILPYYIQCGHVLCLIVSSIIFSFRGTCSIQKKFMLSLPLYTFVPEMIISILVICFHPILLCKACLPLAVVVYMCVWLCWWQKYSWMLAYWKHICFWARSYCRWKWSIASGKVYQSVGRNRHFTQYMGLRLGESPLCLWGLVYVEPTIRY